MDIYGANTWLINQKFSTLLLLRLAFQSLGVVYGDLGTSPLYVFYNTFPDGVDDTEDIIGALSLIIYSLTLIPLLKYVFIVCKATDNGQGKLPSSCNDLLGLCFCILILSVQEELLLSILYFVGMLKSERFPINTRPTRS